MFALNQTKGQSLRILTKAFINVTHNQRSGRIIKTEHYHQMVYGIYYSTMKLSLINQHLETQDKHTINAVMIKKGYTTQYMQQQYNNIPEQDKHDARLLMSYPKG